ncbi:MAG: glycoside hydrolase [Acidobacteriia bacterium]|nr:glycoside hydrolase [Terriglobia bacterium]
MKVALCTVAMLFLFVAGTFAQKQDQSEGGRNNTMPADGSHSEQRVISHVMSCNPAPCVLSPVQPSNGGFVANATIASNPLNPKELLLGSQNNNCPYPSFLGFYISRDGGSTWELSCMISFAYKGQGYDPDFEPVVGYDRRGTAYIAGFYLIEDDFSSFGFEAIQKSSDGGKTWTEPTPALGRSNSTPGYAWLAVDTSFTSPYVDTVYLAAVLAGPLGNNSINEVVVSHSNDGGATWKQAPVAPLQKYPAGDANTNIAVGSDGTVYLTWVYCDTSPNFCDDNKLHVLFSKSSDGGNTWSEPRLIVTANYIYPLPNTDNVGVADIPIIAVDNSSGPHSGNLYVCMYNWTGCYMRVGVIRSSDSGNTESRPVPVAPVSDTHDQFFPWLSVSPTGLVGVSWLDRRNDPANIDYQAFAAISTDGGLSFSPNIQLTTAFSNPNHNGAGNDWMGNYTGNTWAGPNYFVAAWMDTSNGTTTQDVVGGIRLK